MIGKVSELDIEEIENDKRMHKLLNHIKKQICNGNKEAYKYFMQFIAHMIQKPEEKPGVAVHLKSDLEGVGKSELFDFIGISIIGLAMYIATERTESLHGKFNSLTAGKLLRVNEEANIDDKALANEMKNGQTADMLAIEGKGLDVIMVPDYGRNVFLTNIASQKNVTERRSFVIDCSNKHAHEKKYHDEIRKLYEDDEVQEMFMKYMLTYDLTDFDPRHAPSTKIKEEMVAKNKPLAIQFITGFNWGYIGFDKNEKKFTYTKYGLLQEIELYEGYFTSARIVYDYFVIWCKEEKWTR